MNSFDLFTLKFGFILDSELKFVVGVAVAIVVFVLVARTIYSLSQVMGSSSHYSPPASPTAYEPHRHDAGHYRAENERIEAEISNLVKQRELQETREWLARRNQ